MDPAPGPASYLYNPGGEDCAPIHERSLGLGRVWAAIGILGLACLDYSNSELLRNHVLMSGAAFIIYSLLVLLLVRKHRKWPHSARLTLHCLDVLTVVVVGLLVHSSEASLFLLFLFVLVAAAERWGPNQVLWTAIAFAVLLSGGLLLAVTLIPNVDLHPAMRPGATYMSLAGFAVFAAGLLWQVSKTDAVQRWESSLRTAQRVRAHVSRDLHDSAIQSLFTLEYRLDRLKTNPGLSAEVAQEVERLQQLVRGSQAELRQIVEQGRPLDLGRKSFVEYIGDLIAKFEGETGISVRFVFDGGQISPPASVSGELVRIVQEALVNVRKHSGARNVTIGFTVTHGRWMLRIDDDGRGFDFTGRRGMDELEAQSQGPFVIRERVSTLGGELEIESQPGRGSRLEIAFPKDALG